MPTRRIMLIAGEASGDRIAARAVRAARELASAESDELEVFGIGGEECIREGVKCYHTVQEMSVVGFVEVARRFKFFKRVLAEMKGLLTSPSTRPETLVLIDYPGFNIRLARMAKDAGVRVVYYVSPQVWAWHKERVHELKNVVDEMLVIFPFEEAIYREAGLEEAHFIGHPLVERIEEERKTFGPKQEFARVHHLNASKEWLLVFAGSRSEEVRRLMPSMCDAALELASKHNMQPVLVEASSIDDEHYSRYLGGRTGFVRFRASESAHELMHHARLGLLKSGTTTLEAALLGLPGVICYKTHPFTYQVAKRVIKLDFIGLANIVLGEKLYPELLQSDCNAARIVLESENVLLQEQEFRHRLNNLSDRLQLGGEPPSMRAALSILGKGVHAA